jgi:hypothetical protein
MNQEDWVGAPAKDARPFKGPNFIRPTVAEEKALLVLKLGKLINIAPASVRDGSVQVVREWRDARQKAAKVAASQRSSVQELQSAINSMQRWA